LRFLKEIKMKNLEELKSITLREVYAAVGAEDKTYPVSAFPEKELALEMDTKNQGRVRFTSSFTEDVQERIRRVLLANGDDFNAVNKNFQKLLEGSYDGVNAGPYGATASFERTLVTSNRMSFDGSVLFTLTDSKTASMKMSAFCDVDSIGEHLLASVSELVGTPREVVVRNWAPSAVAVTDEIAYAMDDFISDVYHGFMDSLQAMEALLPAVSQPT
jgi:hypothetical protein